MAANSGRIKGPLCHKCGSERCAVVAMHADIPQFLVLWPLRPVLTVRRPALRRCCPRRTAATYSAGMAQPLATIQGCQSAGSAANREAVATCPHLAGGRPALAMAD